MSRPEELARPRWRRYCLLAALPLLPIVVFLLLDALFPFPDGALERPAGRIVEARDGEVLRIFLAPDDRHRLPVTLDEVAPVVVRTLVESEDRWFRYHPGVNPAAIVRAAIANWRAGEIVSGASTISMQVARLVEPKARTPRGKAIEAFRALQLEWHHDKERILEAYLNLAPFGGNLEGIGAAAHFWFGKAPDALSLGEAALLTALPRSPVAYDPIRNPDNARRARRAVLTALRTRGAISEREMADAERQPLPDRLRPIPFRAPHLARKLHESTPRRQVRVRSTVDARTQELTARRVGLRMAELRALGIGNAAAVVIDNESRSLRALVGSAGFFEAEFQGQVDAALARRSPGSTLKPLLYALAMDLGELVPDSRVLDVPTDFAGYIAQNYDGEYRGAVTAAEALRSSLNAPAVRLLARVGLERFHGLLRDGGLETLDRPAIHYGLPLVLGAGEVRLLDLTNLYATLAAGGVHAPVRWLEETPVAEGRRLLSAEASWLTTRILTEVSRPDLPDAWRLTRNVPAVAWKTGTSYGHRDAWAVGFSRRYSIGVWVGNPDGRPRRGISGSEHASPLLFDLFRALENDGARLPRPRGLEIGSVPICPVSRQLAGPFCPEPVAAEILTGRSRLHECEAHRRVFVDAEDGSRLAGACLAERPHRTRVLEIQPPELVAWLRGRGRPAPTTPPLSPACTDIAADQPLAILSPDSATAYLARGGAPASHQGIPLTARAGQGIQRLYWYQDGVLVAAGDPDERLFVSPTPSEHEMVVVDDTGQSSSVRYRVETAASAPPRRP